MVHAILDSLTHMEDGEGSNLDLTYNCNMIRKLGLRLEDRVIEEEADYIQLAEQAENIEKDFDQEVEKYATLMYARYPRNKQ